MAGMWGLETDFSKLKNVGFRPMVLSIFATGFIAFLILNSALDDTNDIGVDTIAAAGTSIYNSGEVPMGIETATLASATAPTITWAGGRSGSSRIFVEFSENVYANTDRTGVIQPSNFVLTDLYNGRFINSVEYTIGSIRAALIWKA